MAAPFQCKQFAIQQDRCAMKVGTDGLLLGAVTSLINNPNSILDIGAGTGLLALMLAQRSDADTIDAIELNENAYEQCVENFEASPWGDRLFCYHASFEEFYLEMDESYDLIISNPPFYKELVSSGNVSRDQARQNNALPFSQLFDGVSRLLSPQGSFSLIIPYSEEENIITMARKKDLFPFELMRIRGNAKSPIKRTIAQFSFSKEQLFKRELIIEEGRHQFTKEYVNLTKAFHLNL